jgi:hypothetical protein
MNTRRTQIAERQPHVGLPYMHNMYVRLLADVSELSGVSLDTPNLITDDWVLNAAPKLDKIMLQWLEGSGVQPDFPGWVKPLWDAFLSSNDGKYLKFLRQILLFCYKVEIEPTNEQLKEAQASFENTDADLCAWDSYFSTNSHRALFRTARQIVGKVIYQVNWSSITPSHGPGAVYPPIKPEAKSDFGTIYSNIEPYYPFYEYFCGIPSFWKDHSSTRGHGLKEEAMIIANLVAVPKDSRGPRLICVHPREAIWIQQGCRRLLESAITHRKSAANGRINFHDQSINGRLALSSSLNRDFVTLDLKEASDCISKELVRFLFGEYAYSYLSCSRATHVRLLDNRVIELRKWASMGNALCFPVQSLIFYALVRSGILSRYGINCNDVYVFGDDILFPSQYYDGVLSALVSSGLRPNPAKTFRRGFFRESCGVDAYHGIDVTPLRLRRLDVNSVTGLLATSDLAKRLVINGYRSTAEFAYRSILKHAGQLPLSNNPDAQGLVRYENCSLECLLRYEDRLRYNKHLHRWEIQAFLGRSANIRPWHDSWWNLQDSLLKLHHSDAGSSENSRLVYPVPHRIRLKRGWLPVL